MLESAISLCEKYQKLIVSEEKGKSHVAHNREGFEVRHFRLDGDMIKDEVCCDFLLLNDTQKKSYFIELKGQDIKRAVEQVLAGENVCRNDLKGYVSYYRIIPGKAPTTKLFPVNYRHLLARVGSERLKCKNNRMEEILV